MSDRRKLLLIGPLPHPGDVIGGTKVSFANLARVLGDDSRFDVTVHDISRPLRGLGRLERLLENARTLSELVGRLLRCGRDHDLVMFNTSSGGALLSGPVVWAVTRLLRRPLAVRVFGGDLDLFLERANPALRWLARATTLRAELVLVQTRLLADRFGDRVRWWPTTRDYTRETGPREPGPRRFLFLSQLRAEKGVAEALEASDGLPEGSSLTLHGPAMRGFDVRSCGDHARAEYRGPLEPAQVQATLEAHDVLVFPSYHEGEGMPGILIEALQCGLPVVSSSWRALPEIIRDGVDGLLVEPRSVEGLRAAMQSLADDEVLFERLSRGALESGERFRGAEWNARLGDWLDELARPRGPRPTATSVSRNYEEAA